MLSMLFETGQPWITFKDPCNIRSPQQHVGMVHSSNLCTEITLNTNDAEIAVCNLGSVNLPAHMVDGKLDSAKLQKTIHTAMRMLDNVIDINYYAVKKARDSNLRHRPVGLGIMGFQDCLHMMRVPYASNEAVEFADRSMEQVCYHAYWASTELAQERGRYSSYTGSLWDRGILPQDSLKLLAEERGGYLEADTSASLDWTSLRQRIRDYGMRNSNCVAIAPTATISNIIGVSACIEPTYQNLYVKSNLSGEFTDINGYMAGASGKKLDETYKLAWLRGLKTTYYLRTIGATHTEKSTTKAGALNAVSVNGTNNSQAAQSGASGVTAAASSASAVASSDIVLDGPACTMRPGDPGFEDCEACQ
jgi:ribonucleoside-diphosphate reductase alpha chain